MIKEYKWRNINIRKKDLLDLLKGKENLIVFDTETTGLANEELDIKEDDIKIIQFSGILYDIEYDDNLELHLQMKDYLNLYINPEELLSIEVSKLTGITNEMLAQADSEKAAAWKIARFMKKSNFWLAYNIPYDLKRLQGLRKRTGELFSLPGENSFSPDIYDVLTLTRDVIDPDAITQYKKEYGIKRKGTYKLDLLTPMLLPEFSLSFHNSLDDVRATALLFEKLLPEYLKIDMKTGTQKLIVKKFSYDVASPYNLMKTRRIVLYTEPKDTSDGAFAEKCSIYWDVSGSVWSCENNKTAKNLFYETDLADIERQVLELAKNEGYIKTNEYEVLNMDTLYIEASKRWEKTPSGKKKLSLSKKIEKERKDKIKSNELENQLSNVSIEL